MTDVVLASTSKTRAKLLRNAGLNFIQRAPSLDETAIKQSLSAENIKARDVADILADMKARKVSNEFMQSLIIGCDQILVFDNQIHSKKLTQKDLYELLTLLSGKTHKLLSAAVIYKGAQAIWRHVGEAEVTMRDLSPKYIWNYVNTEWDTIQGSVGGYKIEKTGVQLLRRIKGDYHSILGIPLLPILSFLDDNGILDR